MEVDNMKKIHTSMVMYIYIHYTIGVWCCDAVDVIAMLMNVEQATFISRILVIIWMCALVAWDCKFFLFEKERLELVDFIVISGLTILGLYKGIYPDTSHDVLCYHVVNQEPGWGEKLGYFWEVSSPLADRLFYLFRVILGYRLGTLFNVVLYILMYFQCKRVFLHCLNSNKGKVAISVKASIYSILCLSLEAALMNLGTYMTDLVGIPILFEALLILLDDVQEDKEYYSQMVYYVILMVILFSFKVSAVIYVFPLLLLYLWKNKKQLTIFKFISCLVLGLLFITPLMIYNLVATGTPLYEVFNLLGSAVEGNGVGDLRWGGQNLQEKILWPIYMALFPQYRHMELVDIPNLFPLAAIVAGFLVGWKNTSGKQRLIFTVFIIPYYLWVIMAGVDRYVLGGLMLAGIFVCLLWETLIENTAKIRGYLLICVCVTQCIGSIAGILVYNNSWQWAPSVIRQIMMGDRSYLEEVKYWGQDKGKLVPDGEQYKHFIVPEKPYSALVSAINPEADILEIYYENYGNENVIKYIKERTKELKGLDESLYSVCMSTDIVNVTSLLNGYGLMVVDVETYEDTYLGNISVLQIEFAEYENEVILLGEEDSFEVPIIENDGTNEINSIVMVAPIVTWTKEPIEVSFYIDNAGDLELLDCLNVVPCEPVIYNREVKKGGAEKIRVEFDGGYGLNTETVYLINFRD